jgi:hypothetical protein
LVISQLEEMAKEKKAIPFTFVLDNLFAADPVVKQMFGCHSVYVGKKIVLALRDKDDEDSGVWIGTSKEHHESLKKDFPNMRSIKLFGPGTSGWQLLSKDADDFESSVNQLCDMILRNDERIGKIPKEKKKA